VILLTSGVEFVSVNENDYVVRSHSFPMNIYNKAFAFINEDLKTKTIACKQAIADILINKEDVREVLADKVILMNGEVYRLVIVE